MHEHGPMTVGKADRDAGARPRKRKEQPAAPPDLRPWRSIPVSGAGLLAPCLPALGLIACSFLPRIAGTPTLALHLRIAAGLLLAWNVLWAARRPAIAPVQDARGEARPSIDVVVRRPHWVQLLTQSGVYVYWGVHWDPVKRYVPLLIAQLLFVYAFDALLSWSRRRPWVLGFAPVPIVLSTNLFLWFKDEYFALQLGMIAFAVLSKELFRWRRDGASRHIFNPSSIALAAVSAVLLVTGTTSATFGYEIALSQDHPPHIHLALFLLGLVVQLNFPVVLVTMSAAVSLVLVGAAYTAATGVYMFSTTSIPGAVLLGSLLLVTDPATSPERRVGKVLFGASYGVLVLVLFPPLLLTGPNGYFDKLLPVPLLNLLVPAFDRAAARITPALEALFARVTAGRLAWALAPRPGNFAHVGIWIGTFGLLYATRAVGSEHEGKSIDFWRTACDEKRTGACERLYAMYDTACDRGISEACHELGAVLDEHRASGGRRRVDEYFAAACDGGHEPGCARLGDLYCRGLVTSDPARAAEVYRRACDAGHGPSCHNLATAHRSGSGVGADPQKAYSLFRRACERGVARGCSSMGAMEMAKGAAADQKLAAEAFQRGCDGGDPPGCANLGIAFAVGTGVAADPARAVEYLGRACDGKAAAACAWLGEMLQKGRGIPADPVRGAVLLQRACQLGHAPACPR
jgi:TPR repeat protein